MKLIKILVSVFTVEAMLVLAFMAYTVHQTARPPEVDESAYNEAIVYDICQQSRISPTIDERGCADLQDQLGYEYLCQANNMSVNNHCWVERKG